MGLRWRRRPPRLRTAMVGGSLMCALAGPAHGGPIGDATLAWSRKLEGVTGHVMPVPGLRGASALAVTLGEGKLLLIGPDGRSRAEAKLDLRADSGPACGVLRLGVAPRIVATDVVGSVYCFDGRGRRLWKHERASRSGGFRTPVIADLHGDGSREIITTDSRGRLLCLDATGKPVLIVEAGNYRVCAPAVLVPPNARGTRCLVFANDAGDVFRLATDGTLIWASRPGGRFGRSLPVPATVANAGTSVLLTGSFVGADTGLVSLDAATGRTVWKAPSEVQAYQSTVLLPGPANGSRALFGDKNTRVYCVGSDGARQWTTQLAGRGIFHAPAVCRDRSGRLLIFQVVRSSGSEVPCLYALDGAGAVVDRVALPGGGGVAPLLCRFDDTHALSLVTLSGSGELQRRDLLAPWMDGEVVWPGPPLPRVERCAEPIPAPARARSAKRARALGGPNELVLTPPAEALYAAVNTKPPNGPRRVSLHYLPYLRVHGADKVMLPVPVDAYGEHDVCVQWMGETGRPPAPAMRYTFVLDRALSADAALQAAFEQRLARLMSRAGARAGLLRRLAASCWSRWDQCRLAGRLAGLENLRRERERCTALAGFIVRTSPKGDVALVQTPDPWRTFDPAAVLRSAQAPNRISVRMLGNETESVLGALVNLTDRALDARLEVGDLRASDSKSTPARVVVALREPLAVRPFSTGRLTDDPLPLLGESATVRLQPGEVRQVWLSLNSRALSPGRHRSTLRLGDIASFGPPAQAALEIEVSSVRLPDRLRYRHCNWLSPAGIADPETRARIVDDALAHGTSVFIAPAPAAVLDAEGNVARIEGGAHDGLAAALKGRAFLLVTGTPSLRWPEGAAPSDGTRDAAAANAVRAYGAHMDSLGWPRSEYALYLQDEPGLTGPEAQFHSFVEAVRDVKKADANMQVYANPAGGARADILKPLVGLVDVWCPDLHLYRADPSGLEPIFRSGQEWWNYEAPGDQRNLDPLGFYRMQAWVAFQHGMQGAGYWVHSYDPYWFDEPGGGSEYGAVYITDGRPVPSKRWEATRDGIEDYELLCMAREGTNQAPDPTSARRLIEEAVSFVTSGQETTSDIGRQTEPIRPDYVRWMEYRRRLIELAEGAL